MSRKLLTNFNAAPYYDDFDLDKNFLKVLFNFILSAKPFNLNRLLKIFTSLEFFPGGFGLCNMYNSKASTNSG